MFFAFSAGFLFFLRGLDFGELLFRLDWNHIYIYISLSFFFHYLFLLVGVEWFFLGIEFLFLLGSSFFLSSLWLVRSVFVLDIGFQFFGICVVVCLNSFFSGLFFPFRGNWTAGS